MRLIQFGTYTLPQFSKRDRLDKGDTGGSIVPLVSGSSYDYLGSDTAPERANTISTSYEIVDTTTSAVQTARDAIRALAGTRAKLWVQMPDTTRRWAWARLARVRMERRREYIYYQPVELLFELAAPGWNGIEHGDPWTLDSGELFDDGLYLNLDDVWTPTGSGTARTVTNDGNRAVTDVTLTITASATATITDVRIVCGDCDWTWEGTVALSTSLVIDCGARSVKNNGVDAYSGFGLNSGHAVADWMRLDPGNNTVTIYYSDNADASATVTFSYFDGWH